MTTTEPIGATIDGHCDERFAGVRAAFERNFTDLGDLGASVAVVVDGETVVDLWGGHLDHSRTTEWQRDSIVNVYSTTKGMVALCAHMLVDRGQLDLDAPVARYWPEFAAAGKERIPVSMLLNHKAGMAAFRDRITLDELCDWDGACARLAGQEAWWEPGTATGYHAVTYGFLVGEVIRRIDGRSVGRFFAEEVADPLDVDFHIGLPVSEHHRVAPLADPPGVDNGPAGFTAALPEIGRAAMGNQPVSTKISNSASWRSAEIPGANGHGNARALARVYGVLACDGERDGVRLLGREAIDRAREPQNSGMNLVLGMELEWRLGFMSNTAGSYGPSPTAFGHGGMGGSHGFADTDSRVGFSYTQNEIRLGADPDLRSYLLAQAVYASLDTAKA
jgi:CubicO group peptidase (beta-lactamase class C family)